MTGSLLMDFVIAVLGLCLVVALFFLVIDKISPDDFFKKVARYAVGGVALIAFLVAVKAVLFGGSGAALTVTPLGVIQFAIGILVVVMVLYIIYMVVDFLAPAPFVVPLKYLIGAIALIALLMLAGQVLFGGGFNMSLPQHHTMNDAGMPAAPSSFRPSIAG